MRTALICATVLTLAACSETTAPVTPIEGTYDLARVANLALPATVPNSFPTTTVTSGWATMREDRTWEATLNVQSWPEDQPTMVATEYHEQGTYRVKGDSIYFISTNDGSTVGAVIRGRQLMATVEGAPFLFVRR